MDRTEILNRIVEIELEMFLSVNAAGNPSCREAPDSFRMHRRAQFSVWSDSTLESYLEDLETAASSGRNLMTYKYARMDDLIPSVNDSPLIGRIASRQLAWQREVFAEYPKLSRNARGLTDGDESRLEVSFERYLRAELESYSERTLEFLQQDVERHDAEGVNMSEKIYLNLALAHGRSSLDSFR